MSTDVARATAAVRRPAPGEPVGWGIVGCGWVARDHVLPGLLVTPGARLAGAYDRDPAAATCLAAVTDGVATTELDALLALPGLHAVYVATPNHAHAAAVAAAAAAGLPVLCEKPLAAGIADAAALVAACERAGVLAGAAFDQRFHPAHRRIAELVAAAELGTVTAVRIVYGCWLPRDWSPPRSAGAAGIGTDDNPHDNWRVDPARAGGGALVDLAPHGIDLVGALLGDDLATLTVLTHTRVHDYPVDDGAVLAGRTHGGALLSAHVSFNTADPLPRRRLEVVGTRAQLVAVDTMGQTAGGTLTRIDAATGAATAVPFDIVTSPFTAQLAAFGAAVAGTADWPWPLRRDLRLHELLHAALERS